jgi:hypothetical protein
MIKKVLFFFVTLVLIVYKVIRFAAVRFCTLRLWRGVFCAMVSKSVN